MAMIRLTIPGQPQGKARSKSSVMMDKKTGEPMRSGKTGRVVINEYTPDSTILYENLVKTMYLQQGNNIRFGPEEPLYIGIAAFYAIPSGTSKKNRDLMATGKIRPIIKPDCDNVEKVIWDAMVGMAFPDDKQITDNTCRKRYSDNPRVEVLIINALEKYPV